MIWNKYRTLFIQVRIDLVARLIITLTFTSEGDISWCYRSNQTSILPYFLTVKKKKHLTISDPLHIKKTDSQLYLCNCLTRWLAYCVLINRTSG